MAKGGSFRTLYFAIQKALTAVVLIILFDVIFIATSSASLLAQDSTKTDQNNYQIDTLDQLVEYYAPLLYLHTREQYKMCSVDWYLERVSKKRFLYYDSRGDLVLDNIVEHVTDSTILKDQPEEHGIQNYVLSHKTNKVSRGDQTTAKAYVHVIGLPEREEIDIQYWFFYAYNGTAAHHEGDWEYVTVKLSEEGELKKVFYSAHSGGKWARRPERDSARLVVYAANKSHAMYRKRGGFHLPFFLSRDKTNRGIAFNSWENYEIIEIDNVEGHDIDVPDYNWLKYTGRWGTLGSDLGGWGGPIGPKTYKKKWDGDLANEL